MTTAQQAFKAPEELLPDELFQRDSSLTADADKMTRPSLSYWSDAWRRFKENKVAVISSAILLVIVLMALIQPMFSRYAYDEIDMFAINQRRLRRTSLAQMTLAATFSHAAGWARASAF